MKHLALIILFLLPGLAMAQGNLVYPGSPQTRAITGYKFNLVRSDSLELSPIDTLKHLSAVAMYRDGNDSVALLKPLVIRRKLKAVVQWNTAPAFTDGWYRLKSGTQTIFQGPVHITTQGIALPPNISQTILSGILSQIGVLQSIISGIGVGEVTVAKFNSFTALTGQRLNSLETDVANKVAQSSYNSFTAITGTTLSGLASDMANRVLTTDFNTYKTNQVLVNSGINSALTLKLSIADTAGFQRRIAGYGLYPNADKVKLAGIAVGATNVDSTLLVRKSTYALDKAATALSLSGKLTQAQADLLYKPLGYVPAWNEILSKPGLFPPSSHTHVGSDIITDATHRFVTDNQIANWNSLSGSGFSGNYNDLINKPTLATVAGTGSYLDLLNRPTLFSGSYADLSGKPTLFSGNYADLIGRPALFSGSYLDLTNKPTVPTSASQVGAVALSDYNNDKSAQGVTDAAQSTSIASLQTNKLDASTYTTNRAADLSTVSSVSSTANTALTTANSATAIAANNSTSIANLQTGKLDLSIYASYTATVATVLTSKLDAGTYTANRSTDQAATTTAQNTANTALSTANSATATGSNNASAITANKASTDAHIANTNNPHGVTTTQIGAVALSAYNTDKTAQGILDAAQSTSIASNTSAIVLSSPRSFTSYAAANAASMTATVPQTWVVTSDETTLDKNGNPIRVTYWFDGVTLLTAPYFKADGTPIGSTSTTLNGYYLKVTVPNKDAANAAATGLQAKIITVTTDDSDGNRPNNKYIYDGDNQPLGQPLF